LWISVTKWRDSCRVATYGPNVRKIQGNLRFSFLSLSLLSLNYLQAKNLSSPNESQLINSLANSQMSSVELNARKLVGKPIQNEAATGLYRRWNALKTDSLLSPENRAIITNFSKTVMTEAFDNTSTVYYPFGGADAIYPILFFPNADTYIIVAAEPLGNLAKGTPADSERVAREMSATFLSASFYKTTDMEAQGTQITKITAALALMDFEIESMEIVSLTEDGVVQNGTKAKIPTSVRWTCKKDGAKKEIYYFAQNLKTIGDPYQGLEKMSESSPFVKFMSHLNGNYTSLYKAASYESYGVGYELSNEISLKAKYYVGSDTGIPFKEFLKRSDSWKLTLLGNYAGTIGLFSGKFQESLSAAYNNKAKYDFVKRGPRMPFRYDYLSAHQGNDASNLTYGIRVK
jgi:hypothetical protein